MLVKFIASCLILLFSTSTIEIIKVSSLKINCNNFTSDNLNNIYSISDNTISQLDIYGKIKSNYSNYSLGKIHYFDTSDPMRKIVFFKDHNQLVFLDNNLSIIKSPLLLDDLNLFSAELICSSTNGGFWVYDNSLMQILYYDKNLEKKYNSIKLSYFKNFETAPIMLLEKNNYIIMQFPDYETLIFDRYAGFIKKVIIPNYFQQIINNNIFYADSSNLIKFNIDLLKYDTITFSENILLEKFRLENDYLITKSNNTIDVYKVLNNF